MSTATRYLIGALVALFIAASYQLDANDEAAVDALVQADKADAIASARIAFLPGERPSDASSIRWSSRSSSTAATTRCALRSTSWPRSHEPCSRCSRPQWSESS